MEEKNNQPSAICMRDEPDEETPQAHNDENIKSTDEPTISPKETAPETRKSMLALIEGIKKNGIEVINYSHEKYHLD